mmetsp:Transcript_7124/g.15393  ORF Transcript_7124/g.15393 Transcript_7124/m.15393 type:complete len:323 (+) Transcript_7124:123-1091(+)|eukprot:CAMPEP_0201151696 /NCGR_PEP_ID=MMETSP0851-20130426/12562_1 /ASSEMBLY_ACC=CAM_ASM_000631 /TAXON_ID=183588 /ORGANISM="Pseudo-nitzschia fraudulenta, Strain WWA7" /LENGTH=322 /DNA_ID=CAMNT_0047428593 /DNA_START=122 /DNA_END=1090 /DNA_ORIENTATION=+
MARTRSMSVGKRKKHDALEEITTEREESMDREKVESSSEDDENVRDDDDDDDDGNGVKEDSDGNDGSGDEKDSDDDESENDVDDEDDEREENEEVFSIPTNRKSFFQKSDKRKNKNEKNALTDLIPGYTAPMRLNSSSLDKYRCGIKELGRRAERKDVSTRDFVLEATAEKANNSMKKTKQGFLPKSYTTAYSHFKRGVKRAPDDTAGKGWFGMKPSAMTDDLKTDLAIIRNRTYLDPKRFYKSTDKHHSVVQMGTVIEGAAEFYSSRLTKKERRANLTEELMADTATMDYAKNKFKKMAKEKSYQAELRKNKPKKRARKFY